MANKVDFFISYTGADRQWAEWIAWQLDKAKFSTFIQVWDFRPGSNFVLEMQKAAADSERTIAVLSEAFFKSGFTQAEWAAAFKQDPTGEKGTLLPVRVAECDLTGLLSPIIYIDLIGVTEERARELLLAGANRERAKPAVAPSFPTPSARSAPTPTFPGALPPIWNVPRLRNLNFTGRKAQLEELHAKLASHTTTALTALRGTGGVGKTQLATEYAFRHASDYEAVWWVRADSAAQFASDFAGLAIAIGAVGADEADQKVQIGAAKAWLEHNGGWLLILDNVPRPDEIEGYLPSGGTGDILITSRFQNWGGVADVVSVDTWPRDDSIDFLLGRTRLDDRDTAGALAEELGDLPLALEHVGAYVEEIGCSLGRYLELFKERRSDMIALAKPPADYDETVATTWGISIDMVADENPAAVELLNLCAFLAPDDIPLGVIREGGEHLPEALATAAADDLAWNDVLAALRKYSLVEVSGDALFLHRLVQAVVQGRLGEDGSKASAEAAVMVVNASFPRASDDVRTWPQCSRLAPHALVASGHAEDLDISPVHGARLLNRLGPYLNGRAQFAEALAAQERALKLFEAALGSDHPDVATSLSNLGVVLLSRGDLAGARERFERALKIDEAVLDPGHSHIARDVNNLGSALWQQGELPGARALYERAIGIAETAYGSDHPNVAAAVNNLGSVLLAQHDVAGALAHFERALKIDESAFDRDHPNVAIDVSNLGSAFLAKGDFPEAQAHFEQALRIHEGAYEPGHPTVGIDMTNLGAALLAQGNISQAREQWERALDIFRSSLGEDHLNTIMVKQRLNDLNA